MLSTSIPTIRPEIPSAALEPLALPRKESGVLLGKAAVAETPVELTLTAEVVVAETTTI